MSHQQARNCGRCSNCNPCYCGGHAHLLTVHPPSSLPFPSLLFPPTALLCQSLSQRTHVPLPSPVASPLSALSLTLCSLPPKNLHGSCAWEELDPEERDTPRPVPRFHHCFCASGSWIAVFGGHNYALRELNDTWLMDAGAPSAPQISWRRVEGSPFARPPKRAYASLTAIAPFGRMLLFGGIGQDQCCHEDAWLLHWDELVRWPTSGRGRSLLLSSSLLLLSGPRPMLPDLPPSY